jgi:hypothetical protein
MIEYKRKDGTEMYDKRFAEWINGCWILIKETDYN